MGGCTCAVWLLCGVGFFFCVIRLPRKTKWEGRGGGRFFSPKWKRAGEALTRCYFFFVAWLSLGLNLNRYYYSRSQYRESRRGATEKGALLGIFYTGLFGVYFFKRRNIYDMSVRMFCTTNEANMLIFFLRQCRRALLDLFGAPGHDGWDG